MKEQNPDPKYQALLKEIAEVCNRHSIENRSDTPDFMLAEYMLGCLTVYENTITNRKEMKTPSNAEKHCTSLDCPELRSICCGAKSKFIPSRDYLGRAVPEYFACSDCEQEFVGGKCTAEDNDLFAEWSDYALTMKIDNEVAMLAYHWFYNKMR